MASVLEKEATEASIQTALYYKFTKSRVCTKIVKGTLGINTAEQVDAGSGM